MPADHDVDATVPSAATSDESATSDVEVLLARVEHARSLPSSDEVDLLVADLETAYEELRVAEDEMRAQRDQIHELLRGRELLRAQHERLVSTLPVAAVVVDQAGSIRSVNHEAAVLAAARVGHLVGKPVLTLFDLDDRPMLRTLISRQALDGQSFRVRATMLAGQVGRHQVEVSVAPAVTLGGGPATEVTWVIMDGGGAATLTDAARERLPEVLVRLAALPASCETTRELLAAAVLLCRAALGDDVEVSIPLGSPAEPDTVASTSATAQQLDGLQVTYDQGPCVDAYRMGRTVVTEDVRADDRWPALGPRVPKGIGAVVGITLQNGQARLGALNVYRTRVGTDAALVETAELLATTIAALLHELSVKTELRGVAADMERALSSRAVIDQAKGIVMAERGGTPDEAFAHLVRIAGDQQVKVRDVARLLVERRGGADPDA